MIEIIGYVLPNIILLKNISHNYLEPLSLKVAFISQKYLNQRPLYRLSHRKELFRVKGIMTRIIDTSTVVIYA